MVWGDGKQALEIVKEYMPSMINFGYHDAMTMLKEGDIGLLSSHHFAHSTEQETATSLRIEDRADEYIVRAFQYRYFHSFTILNICKSFLLRHKYANLELLNDDEDAITLKPVHRP